MKKALIALIILLVVTYIGYNYVMATPKDIQTSKADYSLDSSIFSKEFTTDLVASEKKYTKKVVSLKGKITEVENDGITINKTVYCKLDKTTGLKVGNQIEVKGLFIGYDELLEIIKLDQCSIVK